MFALARVLHLRRHRSEHSRALALRLLRECLLLKPSWRVTDTRYAVDSGINDVFAAFSCRGAFAIGYGKDSNRSWGGSKTDSGNASDVACLRFALARIGYTAGHVQARFGRAGRMKDGRRLPGPYYLLKAPDHTQTAPSGPPRDDLDVAIRIFLLGLALPRGLVEKSLGADASAAMDHLGMLGACPADDSLAVSLVQLFPLDATTMPASLYDPPTTDRPDWPGVPANHSPGGASREQEPPPGPGDLRAATAETGASSRSGESIAAASDLLFATDWPPPASTALREEPVMYIGPDSIGLVQHAPRGEPSRHPELAAVDESILDLCCGSGVQGIAAAALRRGRARITCVDVNPRAVRFARFNACLNGLAATRFTAIVGDLYDALGTAPPPGGSESPPLRRPEISPDNESLPRKHGPEDGPAFSLGQTLDDEASGAESRTPTITTSTKNEGAGVNTDGSSPRQTRRTDATDGPPRPGDTDFDLILANPPFVPVPPVLDARRRRYDVFASGGPTGEDVLRGVFQGALGRLRPGGTLAVVSELANPSTFDARLRQWVMGGNGPTYLEERKTTRKGARAHPGTNLKEPPERNARHAAPGSTEWAGLVFHESRPWGAEEYAARRAGSAREATGWARHLGTVGIDTMGPGFVFVRRKGGTTETSPGPSRPRARDGEGQGRPAVEVRGVDKLWAPHNEAAVESTQSALRGL